MAQDAAAERPSASTPPEHVPLVQEVVERQMRVYASARQWEHAAALLKRVARAGVKRGAPRAEGGGAAGLTLPVQPVRLTAGLFEQVVRAMAHDPAHWQRGKALLRRAHELHLATPSLLARVIRMCAQARQAVEVLHIHKHYLAATTPAAATREHNAPFAAAVKGLVDLRKWAEALHVAEHAQQMLGGQLDEAVVAMGVRGAAGAGEWEAAKHLFQAYVAAGCLPGPSLYRAITFAASFLGKHSVAVRLAREAEREGTASDSTYHHAIVATGLANQLSECMALLEEARDSPCVSDMQPVYHAAVTACLHMGQWSQALALIEEVQAESDPVDIAERTARARVAEQLQLVRTRRSLKRLAEDETDGGEDGAAADLGPSSGDGASCTPRPPLRMTPELFAAALRARALGDDWVGATRTYDAMLQAGVAPTVQVLSELVTALERSGRSEYSDRALEHALEKGVLALESLRTGGMLDFHGLAPSLARAALRRVLREMVDTAQPGTVSACRAARRTAWHRIASSWLTASLPQPETSASTWGAACPPWARCRACGRRW